MQYAESSNIPRQRQRKLQLYTPTGTGVSSVLFYFIYQNSNFYFHKTYVCYIFALKFESTY